MSVTITVLSEGKWLEFSYFAMRFLDKHAQRGFLSYSDEVKFWSNASKKSRFLGKKKNIIEQGVVIQEWTGKYLIDITKRQHKYTKKKRKW